MSHQTKCTIVMYHYVRNGGEFPRINALNVNKFQRQLDYITATFKVISLEEYANFLSGSSLAGTNLCVLTFDDGLKEHYLNVFPILKERKLTASFFPMTQPLSEHVVSAFHKVHFLLAKIGSRMLADQFNLLLKTGFPELVEKHLVDDRVKKQPKYKWDDNLTANLKLSIATLPYKAKDAILSQLFSKFLGDEEMFAQKLYVNSVEMREMQEAGMSFGGHTHAHPMLSHLSVEEQRSELKLAKQILDDALGQETRLFSYPYGDFNEDTVSILKREGYKCAVTTSFSINVGQVDPFALGRLDTNDVPFA